MAICLFEKSVTNFALPDVYGKIIVANIDGSSCAVSSQRLTESTCSSDNCDL